MRVPGIRWGKGGSVIRYTYHRPSKLAKWKGGRLEGGGCPEFRGGGTRTSFHFFFFFFFFFFHFSFLASRQTVFLTVLWNSHIWQVRRFIEG